MKNLFVRQNWSFLILSGFLFFSLFNPWFKKYDYGAGWPLVLLFGVLVFVVAFLEWREKEEKVRWEKIFLGIFGGSFLLSFIFSQTRNFGFSELVAYLAVSCAYLIFAYREISWKEGFLKFIGVAGVLAVGLGYVFYFVEPENRMFGIFFNIQYHANVWPNAFALFLLMIWPVILLAFKNNWLRAGLIGFVLSGLLLTYSRGAFIAFGGEVVLLAIYFLRRMNFKTIGFILLSAVLAIALFWSANYLRSLKYEVIDVKERVAFGNNEGLTSKMERKEFWKGAMEMALEKPVFGYGPFSFRQVYNGKQDAFLANSDHPHNIFLKIAAENGMIALGGFLGFLAMILVTVAGRFSRLEKRERDFVFILATAVAGALAHNLIDYNFNFIANLLLLFLFLAFIRSVVAEKAVQRNFSNLILSGLIAVVVLFEGAMLFFDQLDYSFFPRNNYLSQAQTAMSKNDFEGVFAPVNKEISLNKYDSEAYYLRGLAYCRTGEREACRVDLLKAIEVNPLNNLAYYRDYIGTITVNYDQNDQLIVAKALRILKDYFELVEKNVHFTAFSPNVEAAADLGNLLMPYLDSMDARIILEGVYKMKATAERLRSTKDF